MATRPRNAIDAKRLVDLERVIAASRRLPPENAFGLIVRRLPTRVGLEELRTRVDDWFAALGL